VWEPRRLTTLWASTACYRENFTSFNCSFYLSFTLPDTLLARILKQNKKKMKRRRGEGIDEEGRR
jgi:hypothetical protein